MNAIASQCTIKIQLRFRWTIVLYITVINMISTSSVRPSSICLTPACVEAGNDILRKMDPSVDPCDNFYKFACGKYLNMTVIDSNVTRHSTFTEIEHHTIQKTYILLSDNSEEVIKPFQQAKKFFNLCMNASNMLMQMDEALVGIFDELGGWPVVKGDEWNGSNINWDMIPGTLMKAGYPLASTYFLPLSFKRDIESSTKYAIIINSPSSHSRKRLMRNFNDIYSIMYYNYLVKYAVKSGAKLQTAEKELREALQFHIDLVNIPRNAENISSNVSVSYVTMTIDEMIKKWPTIDWMTYIIGMLSIAPNINIEKNETVLVYHPSYITKFEMLINSTSKRVVVNYALYRVLQDSLRYLITDFSTTDMIEDTRWKTCVEETVVWLPDIVTALYVRNYIDDHAKAKVMDMVINIKEQFIKMFGRMNWLDSDTRNNMIDKIASMNAYVGYPDRYLSDRNMSTFYRDLELDGDNFFRCVLNVSRFHMMITYKTISEKRLVMEQWPGVTTLNAFYFEDNYFTMSSGFFQHPFFEVERPAYMNYGIIGAFIAHEMSHSFDNKHRFIDKDGNELVWEESSDKNFTDNMSCMINQYNNFTDEEIESQLNGTLTQNENIGDYTGAKISYFAYRDWIKRHGSEPALPNLNYTPKQMFWISMASIWCSKSHPKMHNFTINHDVHPPEEFRVIGMLSNIRQFSKDFNCPLGSPMNPRKKCTIF